MIESKDLITIALILITIVITTLIRFTAHIIIVEFIRMGLPYNSCWGHMDGLPIQQLVIWLRHHVTVGHMDGDTHTTVGHMDGDTRITVGLWMEIPMQQLVIWMGTSR